VVHIGQEALTVRVWEQDHEGYLTPTHRHSAHVFNRVQHLLVSTLKSGKRLVVGPSEGAPPQLKHYEVRGRSLAKCESKHFCKALRKNLTKKDRHKLQELCKYWSSFLDYPFTTATMAKLKANSSKLPLMQQETWVHTKVLHKAHMVGSHQSGPNAQHECEVCQELDTHEHAFMHCPMAAFVWQSLLKWTESVWAAEKLTSPKPSVALCMLGLMPTGTPRTPPRWWQLLQRIALRWIWVTHAQRLYGTDMMYSDPTSLLSHIQQEFESRIKWDWNKFRHKHTHTHISNTAEAPREWLKKSWGQVAICDTQGKEVSLVLPPTEKE
jgi:hypothetical protein